MEIQYSIVDVFTSKRFGGNPVAVIHDAATLDDATMQAIAKEFGFAETTFVLGPQSTESTARVRIFTPVEEIPFAGHPNIGTAFVVATEKTSANVFPGRNMVFEELGGMVRVCLMTEAGTIQGAEIIAPQSLEVPGEVEPALVARCLGLSGNCISTRRLNPCVASVGLPFAFVELNDLAALESIELDFAAFRQAAEIGPPTVDGFSICAFFVEEESESLLTLRTRVFSPLGFPLEDPATGSASGALGALLARCSGRVKRKYRMRQGIEIGRPSEIWVEMDGVDRPPSIKGHCILFSRGTITI